MPRFYALARRPLVTEDGQTFRGLPPGTIGAVDLAPLSGDGFVFAVSDAPWGAVEATFGDGTSLDGYVLSGGERAAWRRLIDVAVPPGTTLLDALWDTLTVHADPDGLTRAKPLMPTRRGDLELHLGGHSRVRVERLPNDPTQHPAWPNIQRVIHNDYRRIRAQDRTLARKWLGAQRLKYRLSAERAGELLVPPDLGPEAPIAPETTITESFNTADSSTLGPDLSWTEFFGDFEVVSNRCRKTSGNARSVARADSDLSSDDHYAEAAIYPGDGGAVVRKDGTATQQYYQHAVKSDQRARIFRSDDDSGNTAISIIISGVVTDGDVCRLEADGSTLTAYWTGIEQVSVTDTTYTGHLRTGLFAWLSNTEFDDFEASDLGLHELLADDVESASEVTQPSISQVHGLAADDLQSTSEVTEPGLAQVHALAADNLESASEVTQPAIAETENLAADDLESATEVTEPAIAQVHSLAASDVESASEVTEPGLGQTHGLIPDELESASEVSSPAIAQVHGLAASDVESASETTEPGLQQVHGLGADDVEAASEITQPGLSEKNAFTAVSLGSASEVTEPAIAQVHTFAADSVESASETSEPGLTQAHDLAADNLESAAEVTAPTLSENVADHALMADDVESASEVSLPVLAVVGSASGTPFASKSILLGRRVGRGFMYRRTG